jgi:two-component system, OmpR family, response regulator
VSGSSSKSAPFGASVSGDVVAGGAGGGGSVGATAAAGSAAGSAGAGVGAGAIKVLLVEDDARLAQLTARYLETHEVLVTVASTGPEGQAEALRRQYDCVVLDLMLPGRDGIEVCRQLRARTDVPIVMVTARGAESDRVLGLEVGADDYVTKPFSARELLARIRANVRRSRGQVGPPQDVLSVGGLVLDPAKLEVTVDGKPVAVTSYEFAILRALAQHPGRPLSREQLLDLAKGSAEQSFDRSIDVHVSRLRAKLGSESRGAQLLKTVRGAGYMLVGEREAAREDE